MLLNLFREGFTVESLIQVCLYIVIILISLSVHELFHGYVAYRCGDATARNLGRLTLNPFAHLDPIGTIMMLVVGFGYAKPVPINPRNFNHYKRDLCFVSFAGPLSNLILAFVGAVLYTASMLVVFLMGWYNADVMYYWSFFCVNFIYANASLCIFNLLPLPPLDGSRILSTVLPQKIAYYYLKYERYIMLVVFALLYLNVLDGILSFLAGGLYDGIMWFVNLIFTPIVNLIF